MGGDTNAVRRWETRTPTDGGTVGTPTDGGTVGRAFDEGARPRLPSLRRRLYPSEEV
jgi:hypothetical protein